MMKKESKSPLPISLKSIEIENFAGIKHTSLKDLPSDAQWIFLTGENGFGKTSVLRGIGGGLFPSGCCYWIDTESSIGLKISRFGNPISINTKFRENTGGSDSSSDEFNELVTYGASRIEIAICCASPVIAVWLLNFG